uniref:Uncharacterized protein n=1 Tax=Anguilla anguilla TaxID=7936 RepID=A0A0E9TV22_ANGAN
MCRRMLCESTYFHNRFVWRVAPALLSN